MTINEYEKIKNYNYNKYCDYLKEKYGEIKEPYFINQDCRSQNRRIKKSKEGLFIHHIREDTYINLSDEKIASKYSYDFQQGYNLVYCNYLEHLLLHIMIAEEYEDGKGIGGAIIIIKKLYNYFKLLRKDQKESLETTDSLKVFDKLKERYYNLNKSKVQYVTDQPFINIDSTSVSRISLNSKPQRDCYNKLDNYKGSRFLIAAKPRFGKTYVTCKLLVESNAWKANIAVIVSGKNVRDEWKKAAIAAGFEEECIITTNEELNRIKRLKEINKLDKNKRWLIFLSTQKLRIENNVNDDEGIDDQSYIDFFNTFKGRRILVFDEAHFAEQSATSQNLISRLNTSKTIYLSGTPWTDSIMNQFSEESTFKFTYTDECKLYEEDILHSNDPNYEKNLNYIPITYRMFILDTYVPAQAQDISEDWDKVFKDKEDLKIISDKLINMINLNGRKNIIIFFEKVKHAEKFESFIIKNFSQINIKSAAGNLNKLTGQDANEFLEKHKGEINFILTCDRLGTGCTINALDCCVFLKPTRSAIEFMQHSMRCGSEYEGKETADIICCNKFGAFEVYRTFSSRELRNKHTSKIFESDFNEMQKYLPLFAENEGELRPVNFAEATDFEHLYIHGKTKLFTDMSLDELENFKFDTHKAIRNSISKSIKSTSLTSYEKQKLNKDINTALDMGRNEEAFKMLAEAGCSIKRNSKDTYEGYYETKRKTLENHFITLIEDMLINNMKLISIDCDDNIFIDYNNEIVNDKIIQSGFTLDVFKNIIYKHPDYVKVLKNYVDIQLQNLSLCKNINKLESRFDLNNDLKIKSFNKIAIDANYSQLNINDVNYGGYPENNSNKMIELANLNNITNIGVLNDISLQLTHKLLNKNPNFKITIIYTNKEIKSCIINMYNNSKVINKISVEIKSLDEVLKDMNEKFDLVFANPPYSIGNETINNVMKVTNKAIVLMPLSNYNGKNLYKRVTSLIAADPKEFKDANISENLAIAKLDSLYENPQSYDEFKIYSMNQAYKDYYKLNLSKPLCYKKDYASGKNKKGILTNTFIERDFLKVTNSTFYFGLRSNSKSAHSKSGKIYHYNCIENLTKSNIVGLGGYLVTFKSKQCLDNYKKFHFNNNLSIELAVGLNNKGGDDPKFFIPNIDWSKDRDYEHLTYEELCNILKNED